MPKFYVGLDQHTRYNYSPIGDRIRGEFIYMGEFERRVWLGEVTGDINRLAELVNGANECVRFMNFVDLPMKVFRVDEPAQSDPFVKAVAELEAESKPPIHIVEIETEPPKPEPKEETHEVSEPTVDKPRRRLRRKTEGEEEKPAEAPAA